MPGGGVEWGSKLLTPRCGSSAAAAVDEAAYRFITEGRAPDEVYAEVRKEFGEEELVNLSLAIIRINGWNRLAIGFRKIPGEYQPHKIA
jgi:alkylhydroperoxidase family enzyme